MALYETVKHPKSGTWYVDYGHRHMECRHKWVAFEMGWAGVSWMGFDTRKEAEAYVKQRNAEGR